MREYAVEVNGRKYRVRKETDDSVTVTIPVGSPRMCQNHRDIFFPIQWKEPMIAEDFRAIAAHVREIGDHKVAEEYERKAQELMRVRQATVDVGTQVRRRRYRVLPKVQDDERKAQIERQIKERQDKEETPPIKPDEGENVEDFMKRCVVTKTPEECQRLWKEAHPESEERQACFDKASPSPPSYPPHLKRFARRR